MVMCTLLHLKRISHYAEFWKRFASKGNARRIIPLLTQLRGIPFDEEKAQVLDFEGNHLDLDMSLGKIGHGIGDPTDNGAPKEICFGVDILDWWVFLHNSLHPLTDSG